MENLDDFVKELKAVRPDINVILDDIEMNYKINRLYWVRDILWGAG